MVINQKVKYNSSTDQLSLIFAALADPTRRSIIERLSRTDATVNELAAPYDMSLPAVSKHLKILEEAGLISATRQAQMRPRHLEADTLHHAIAWIDAYRKLWDANLDNLDTYLENVQLMTKEKPYED